MTILITEMFTSKTTWL